MSLTTPRAVSYEAVYGPGQGRGDVEFHVIKTLRDWIIPYIADYEAERGIPIRSLPVPPTPESIHGDMDFTRFSSELFPELQVIVQPTGEVERNGDGTYGSWYDVMVSAVVEVTGTQDGTRALADIYGTVLQKLLPQQGEFGTNPDGTEFATRTRLRSAYGLTFPDASVRDVLRATVSLRTFVSQLLSDSEGLRVPPQNPYGVPTPWPDADRVEVNLVRATPDDYSGLLTADAVILDGTVNPPVTEYGQVVVDVPSD